MSHANDVEKSTIADLLSAVSTLGLTTLDLNGRELSAFPDGFPVCPKLECLYLEGNALTSVPCNLAVLCPSLVWLDLRNNRISVIPPEISKIRNLKTLLLEGNKLQELPLELGLLYSLSGLSLSDNPLQSPPTHIIQQGTKAVLQYLREQREGGAMEGEGDGEIISGEDSSDEEEGQVGVASDQGRGGQRVYKRNSIPRDGGRGLSSHRATLYSNLELQKKRQVHIANLLSSMDKLRRTASAKSGKRAARKPRPLPDPAERGKIADKIERQKSKQCLDDWREETRRRQGGGMENSSHVITRPPFATMATNEEPSNRIINVPQTTQEPQHGEGGEEGGGGGVLTDWTKEFARQLQYNREVTMGTSSENVTDDLLSAEQKLAKALAGRKTFESNANKRQYRLKAFTGDTLF